MSSRCSETARPWTFWYWMYGAVSKPGIKADLQAMKDVGLGGCYLMPIRGVQEKPEFEGKAQQLTPEFWSMVDYAFAQADSLGLEMGIHVCDGFALAGGPWITPEESMQRVVWSDTIVCLSNGLQRTGLSGSGLQRTGSDLERLLPAPPVAPGQYYEDIAFFACPVGDDRSVFLPATIGGTIQRDDNGTFRSKEPGHIDYTFDTPVTVQSVEVVPSGNNIQAQRLLVQASDDGIAFRNIRQLTPPRQGWQNTDQNYTYALPETTARHFRFSWTPEGTPPGAEDYDAAKWSPVLKVKDIRLSPFPVIDQYESKNGSIWRISHSTFSSKGGTDGKPVRLVVNDGKVVFPFPLEGTEGRFRILRFGHTTTGHTNATAGGAKGLECDKFSVQAVEKQIDHWFGQFIQRPHHDVVKYMHVDSWECGSQNWSKNFAEEFQKRRGYDLLPYLPVYAGVPMENAEQVLRDIRLTINDLLQDVFFKTVARKAKAYGVQLSCESVAPTMVSDGMAHYKHADLPMGEFWLNSPTHDKPNDMLDAISGAHVYGKPIVQAEGFTEVRGVWDETPASIKPLLDRNLALGMNRLFFHVFTHNPWLDKKPGMTLDGIGLFFQRDQTWFPESKALVDYVTRCQRWLQKGVPVVDIAVYTGEEMPRRAFTPDRLVPMLPGLFGPKRVASEQKRLANAGCPMEESPVGVRHNANILDLKDWVNPLHGYHYDSMNKDALLEYGTNETQKPHYRALVIPEGSLLSDEARARIDQLRRQGMLVIDRPWRADTLAGIPRDVILDDGLAYTHRRDGEQDIYFLANQTDAALSFYAAFRIADKDVVVYDPMTDSYTSPIDDILRQGSRTIVRLELKPWQSLFVLFGTKGLKPRTISKWTRPLEPNMPKHQFSWKQKGKWNLHFKESGLQMKTDTLFAWNEHSEAGVRFYSGHVSYTATLQVKWKNLSNNIILSLGDVRDVAHVWVNGRDCGILWMPPYEVDITHALKNGKNIVEVEVVNTWHNALRGTDLGTPPYDGIWTNARYRTKGDALLPAGLLGPVELRLE
ncbi:MAG: DNA-binding protein [Prevotella sp.]|nr:DNA-binding protein [Prevotella sp.]